MKTFDAKCTRCTRLATFLGMVRRSHPGYYALPVPPFGDRRAVLVVVGLAPGMHGANRTGRPFTGDYAGVLLFRTLHKFGFASHAGSADPRDGLELNGCRVTNAVKCLPPRNRPEMREIRECNPFLAAELAAAQPRAIVALGAVAHRAVLMAFGLQSRDYPFRHHAVHTLAVPDRTNDLRLYDSYHCSRYNTQTRRLTADMFEAVFRDIRAFLSPPR